MVIPNPWEQKDWGKDKYSNQETLTAFTSTYNPTPEDVKKEIISLAKRLASKKWYEEKKYLVDNIKYKAKELEELEAKIK